MRASRHAGSGRADGGGGADRAGSQECTGRACTCSSGAGDRRGPYLGLWPLWQAGSWRWWLLTNPHQVFFPARILSLHKLNFSTRLLGQRENSTGIRLVGVGRAKLLANPWKWFSLFRLFKLAPHQVLPHLFSFGLPCNLTAPRGGGGVRILMVHYMLALSISTARHIRPHVAKNNSWRSFTSWPVILGGVQAHCRKLASKGSKGPWSAGRKWRLRMNGTSADLPVLEMVEVLCPQNCTLLTYPPKRPVVFKSIRFQQDGGDRKEQALRHKHQCIVPQHLLT